MDTFGGKIVLRLICAPEQGTHADHLSIADSRYSADRGFNLGNHPLRADYATCKAIGVTLLLDASRLPHYSCTKGGAVHAEIFDPSQVHQPGDPGSLEGLRVRPQGRCASGGQGRR